MPTLYCAVQIGRKDGCKHHRLHTFPMPSMMEKGYYHTVRSYDSFAHGAVRGSCIGRCCGPDFLYVCKRHEEFLEEQETQFKIMVNLCLEQVAKKHDDRNLPVTEHESFYAFLEAIGYNRKTKKWRK